MITRSTYILNELGGFRMRYFRKIIGERLYLSPVNTDDAEQYIKWMNDKAVW
jgi:hypothetical protein